MTTLAILDARIAVLGAQMKLALLENAHLLKDAGTATVSTERTKVVGKTSGLGVEDELHRLGSGHPCEACGHDARLVVGVLSDNPDTVSTVTEQLGNIADTLSEILVAVKLLGSGHKVSGRVFQQGHGPSPSSVVGTPEHKSAGPSSSGESGLAGKGCTS